VAEFSANPMPYAFSFSNRKDHLLALRYSDFHRDKAKSNGINLGSNFQIEVKHLNEEISKAANPTRYFPFVFLFFYFHKERPNCGNQFTGVLK